MLLETTVTYTREELISILHEFITKNFSGLDFDLLSSLDTGIALNGFKGLNSYTTEKLLKMYQRMIIIYPETNKLGITGATRFVELKDENAQTN